MFNLNKTFIETEGIHSSKVDEVSKNLCGPSSILK